MLRLGGLHGITTLEGLESVTEVGSLDLSVNSELATIAGLDNLSSVTSNLEVTYNPMLPQAEVEAWADGIAIDGDVTICENLDGPPCR